MSSGKKEKKEDEFELVKDICARLSEHFDHVQVFVSKDHHDSDKGVVQCDWGKGNYLARYGQVREWVVYQDAITRERAKGE